MFDDLVIDAVAVLDAAGVPLWVFPGMIVAAIVVGGMIFKTGGWHGKVNSDLAVLREELREVRDDIRAILARLPAAKP